jgi:hypothetical protein
VSAAGILPGNGLSKVIISAEADLRPWSFGFGHGGGRNGPADGADIAAGIIGRRYSGGFIVAAATPGRKR